MAVDLTKVYKRYKGLWVALLDDEKTVVGSGESLEKALKEANKNGHKHPIIMRMPTEILPYVGSFWS